MRPWPATARVPRDAGVDAASGHRRGLVGAGSHGHLLSKQGGQLSAGRPPATLARRSVRCPCRPLMSMCQPKTVEEDGDRCGRDLAPVSRGVVQFDVAPCLTEPNSVLAVEVFGTEPRRNGRSRHWRSPRTPRDRARSSRSASCADGVRSHRATSQGPVPGAARAANRTPDVFRSPTACPFRRAVGETRGRPGRSAAS